MATFHIEAVRHGNRCTLVLSGEADLAVADDITRLGSSNLSEPSIQLLILDLRDVTFMDSTALGALVHLRNLANTSRKHLQLAHTPVRIQRVLELTGLAGSFDITIESS